MNPSDLLTIVFVTIARDESAQRFVRSVRSRFKSIRLLAADQNGPNEERGAFYEDHDVDALWLPRDCGLSFARNRALEQVHTPYVLLADDDFIFTDATELETPLRIMESARRIGFLGGRLVDVRRNEEGEDERYLRRWEKNLVPLPEQRTLITIPMDYLPLRAMEAAGETVYRCDMPMNWGVMRTAVYGEQLRWDERIKINGEHEDFFLNMKLNSSWLAAYYPGLLCDHQWPQKRDYHILRSRQQGRKVFADKWGFDHHLELGVGLRDFNRYTAYEEVPVFREALDRVPSEPEISAAPPPVSTSGDQDSLMALQLSRRMNARMEALDESVVNLDARARFLSAKLERRRHEAARLVRKRSD